MARRERAASAPPRDLPRAARRGPRRRRRAASAAALVKVPSRSLDPVDRGHGSAHRGAPVGAVRDACTSTSASPGRRAAGCFLANGTGLAAGQPLLEAVSHALCEVVERDAFALWKSVRRTDRAARRRSTSTRVTDPGCRRLLDAYAQAGVGVIASDLTTDVGLPVFSVTIVDRRRDRAAALPGRDGRRLPSRPRGGAVARADRGGAGPAHADRRQPGRLHRRATTGT